MRSGSVAVPGSATRATSNSCLAPINVVLWDPWTSCPPKSPYGLSTIVLVLIGADSSACIDSCRNSWPSAAQGHDVVTSSQRKGSTRSKRNDSAIHLVSRSRSRICLNMTESRIGLRYTSHGTLQSLPAKRPLLQHSVCVVCGKEITYTFGRPRRVCSHECYLMWKQRRYYRAKFLKRVIRISRADVEFEPSTCECGSKVLAWTLEGVFCMKCGLESRSHRFETWIPAEFIPVPACRCSGCKRKTPYLIWLYA